MKTVPAVFAQFRVIVRRKPPNPKRQMRGINIDA